MVRLTPFALCESFRAGDTSFCGTERLQPSCQNAVTWWEGKRFSKWQGNSAKENTEKDNFLVQWTGGFELKCLHSARAENVPCVHKTVFWCSSNFQTDLWHQVHAQIEMFSVVQFQEKMHSQKAKPLPCWRTGNNCDDYRLPFTYVFEALSINKNGLLRQ